ncbi:MAG: two-component system sensor histidine kinase CreC [Gammaproteobacteria bacterium]|nr:two-component system sensor histidine kinase CreC [Gammaproteobacteria bacterium]
MSIRLRMFIGISLLLAVGFYFFVDTLMKEIQPRYREATEEPIVDTARILAAIAAETAKDGHIDVPMFRHAIDGVRSNAFEARIYNLLKTRVDVRVYITDDQGKVLYDSDQGRAEGEDYSQWRDIYLTLRGQYGARTSPSPLDSETKILYVSAPIMQAEKIIGVLSVGKSAANSNRFVDIARRQLLLGSIGICLSLIVIGLLLGHWLTRPIRRLTDYAQGIRDGHRTTLPPLPPGELRDMGAAFEEMRVALEGKRYVANYVQSFTHEIKGPLSAIHGASELLKEELPTAQRRHFINNIRVEADRITRIAETLMLLTSLESRLGIVTEGWVALDRVAREAGDSLVTQLEADRKGLDLFMVDAVRVQGEENLIRQAVINLLQNAIDFSPPDSQISLIVKATENHIQLEVQDQGSGIPEYAREKIFNRFYSLARPGSGRKSSGLGLSLVKEIMILHGGEVLILCPPEGGTIATLSFPPETSQ